MVISSLLSHPAFCAAGSSDTGSMTHQISEDVYRALSDLMLLARDIQDDIRGDRPAPDELILQSPQSSLNFGYGTNSNEMALRASNLRNAAKQNVLPQAYGNQATEFTLYQNGDLGKPNYSRLGAYMRVDQAAAGKNELSLSAKQPLDNEGYSLTLGGDYLFNDRYLLGVALGLPFDEAEDKNNGSEIDGLVASGYFSYFHDDWYVDFTASYALIDTDIDRRIRLYSDTVINDTNEADSDIWVFSLGSGYIVDYNYLNIAFESTIQHTLSDTERYTERPSKGNSNYLISKVDNVNNLDSTVLITGVSISHPLRSSMGIFQPYVRGYVHYDIDSGNEKVISQLKTNHSGSILPIIVHTDDELYGRVHLGISGVFNRDWNGYAEASTLIGLDDLSAYTFTVGVRIPLD